MTAPTLLPPTPLPFRPSQRPFRRGIPRSTNRRGVSPASRGLRVRRRCVVRRRPCPPPYPYASRDGVAADPSPRFRDCSRPCRRRRRNHARHPQPPPPSIRKPARSRQAPRLPDARRMHSLSLTTKFRCWISKETGHAGERGSTA
eukprot:366052-Chlamydomonas_euryale.AAC.13